ncbi:MAG: PD40 domain-containing protein [Phycisphaerae bacterium]|nr:PD40 domain-containing protein [Gemmatimonadaceae bacterium]
MLRIVTFGGLSVGHPERELSGAVLQPRRLAILAVLARSSERGITRERLLSLFWPDDEEERARRALTQAIYALRRDLGNDGAIVGNQELRLDAECITSDVAEFALQLKRGRLAEAAALYAGPFLQGFHLVGVPAFERWADDERTAIAHDYARTRERLATSAERAHNMTEAAEHWRVLATVDPLNANVAVRYMTALEAVGDRASALKHARIYETLVSQELELPPDRAVIELAARLRAAAPRVQPTPEPAAGPENAALTDAMSQVAPSELPEVLPTAPVLASSSPQGPATTPAPTAGRSPAQTSEPTLAQMSVQSSAQTLEQSPAQTAEVTPAQASVQLPTDAAAGAIQPAATIRVGRTAIETRPTARSFWTRPVLVVLGAGTVLALVAAVVSQSTPAARIGKLRVGETKRVTFEETLELDPAIAPDGHMVAYAGGTEGAMKLYVRQLDGGNPVLISGAVPGDHRRPRWSHGGTHILFQADRAIYMVPSLGGSARVIVEAPVDSSKAVLYPTWSPDGKSIAWVDDMAVRVREVDGTSARTITQLKDAHSLAWSPDGKFLAVATDNEAFVYGARGALRFASASIGNIAPGIIYIVNATNGDTTRLTETDYLSTSPEWLGDSRTLVFVSNKDGARDLYAASVSAGGERVGDLVRLTTGLDAHTVSVSNDGTTLAYTTFRQSANLYAVTLSNSAAVSVTQAQALTQGQQTIEAMDISPDGKWIAFDSDRGGQQDIFRVRTDSAGETDRVVSSPTDDFHPAWSPDGRTLAFYRIRDGVRRGAIVSATGGGVRFVGPTGGTLEEHSPVWTPDGQQLLFHRFIGAQPDLYAISRTGDSTWNQPVRLTDKGGIWPVFSPDGRSIAYFSGAGEISVMSRDANSSSRRVIVRNGANGQTAMYMRWPPNTSELIVRARDAKGLQTIWEVSPDGNTWRPLVLFNDARRPSIRPEFATDGRRIYFTLAERSADVFTARLELQR